MSRLLAVWRTDSRLERDLTEENRCSARQKLSTQIFAISLVLAPFAALVPASETVFFLHAAVASAVVSCLGISSLVLAAQARKVRMRNARRLGEEYAVVGGFLARTTVFMGEAAIGSDHGIVWSEEGRLYFAGPRTSFGLFASQVGPLGIKETKRSLRLPLRVSSRTGLLSLEFMALAKGKELGEDQQQAHLAWMIHSWLAQTSVGEGQWPPLTLGPDAPNASVLFLRAIGSTLFWGVNLLLGFGLLIGMVANPCIVIAMLPFSIGAAKAGLRVFPQPFESWLVWGDRRRLDQETT